jgi:hypothetical protein
MDSFLIRRPAAPFPSDIRSPFFTWLQAYHPEYYRSHARRIPEKYPGRGIAIDPHFNDNFGYRQFIFVAFSGTRQERGGDHEGAYRQ